MKPRAFLADPPHSFAHRGGALLWPENTLLAFQGALELGVSHIESDVHLTRDGHIVVFHDDRVERTTNGSGLIREMTLAEVKRLDAGHRFRRDRKYPYRGQGVEVPTLLEVIEQCPGIKLNLELKQREPSMVQAVWDFVQQHELEDRILIAAAQDCIVQEFRRACGGRMATSAGLQEVLRFWAATRVGLARFVDTPYDALQVPPREGPLTVVDRCFVEAAHDKGLQVHVWTIDEPAEMHRLWDLGVDCVMSDRPDVLMQAFPGRS